MGISAALGHGQKFQVQVLGAAISINLDQNGSGIFGQNGSDW
jgi:hypothetical protein